MIFEFILDILNVVYHYIFQLELHHQLSSYAYRDFFNVEGFPIRARLPNEEPEGRDVAQRNQTFRGCDHDDVLRPANGNRVI